MHRTGRTPGYVNKLATFLFDDESHLLFLCFLPRGVNGTDQSGDCAKNGRPLSTNPLSLSLANELHYNYLKNGFLFVGAY